jgi:hypothetical protein
MSRLRALLLLPLFAAPLAACGGSGEGTNFSIHAEGGDGNVTVATVQNGLAEIKGPGIEGSLRLPKLQMDAADFDINGMKLYPGSTIHDFNINAKDRPGEKDDGSVTLSFTSPAALAKVQGWFRDKMAERAFKVTPQGNGFVGTTGEGDPITLELEADGSERAKGKLRIGK